MVISRRKNLLRKISPMFGAIRILVRNLAVWGRDPQQGYYGTPSKGIECIVVETYTKSFRIRIVSYDRNNYWNVDKDGAIKIL